MESTTYVFDRANEVLGGSFVLSHLSDLIKRDEVMTGRLTSVTVACLIAGMAEWLDTNGSSIAGLGLPEVSPTLLTDSPDRLLRTQARVGEAALTAMLGTSRRATLGEIAVREAVNVRVVEAFAARIAPVVVAAVSELRDSVGSDHEAADELVREYETLARDPSPNLAGWSDGSALGIGGAEPRNVSKLRVKQPERPLGVERPSGGSRVWLWWTLGTLAAAVGLALVLSRTLSPAGEGTEAALPGPVPSETTGGAAESSTGMSAAREDGHGAEGEDQSDSGPTSTAGSSSGGDSDDSEAGAAVDPGLVDDEGHEGHGDNDEDDAMVPSGTSINDLLDLPPITFQPRSSDIDPDGHEALGLVVTLLTENPEVRVEIGGHTDNDGGRSENKRLSQDRAEAVSQFLQGEGINGDRLEVVGYGESQPVVPNDSADNKAINRRIEFMVI